MFNFHSTHTIFRHEFPSGIFQLVPLLLKIYVAITYKRHVIVTEVSVRIGHPSRPRSKWRTHACAILRFLTCIFLSPLFILLLFSVMLVAFDLENNFKN